VHAIFFSQKRCLNPDLAGDEGYTNFVDVKIII
jgi:hypothetical protein